MATNLIRTALAMLASIFIAGVSARALPFALAAAGAAALAGTVRLSATGLWLALASGVLASGLGYAVWYAALRGLSATRAAIVQLAAPPLAAAGAVATGLSSATVRQPCGSMFTE